MALFHPCLKFSAVDCAVPLKISMPTSHKVIEKSKQEVLRLSKDFPEGWGGGPNQETFHGRDMKNLWKNMFIFLSSVRPVHCQGISVYCV